MNSKTTTSHVDTIVQKQHSQQWHAAGAVVTGAHHLTKGLRGQDAFCSFVTTQGALVLAVADGAGSTRFGGWGARIATKTVIRHCQQHFPAKQTELSRIFDLAHRAVKSTAARRRLACDEFACTLLVVVIHPEQRILAGQIGDGAIVAQSRDGYIGSLFSPNYTTAINETHFITSFDYQKHTFFSTVDTASLAALALFSDGFEPAAMHYSTGMPHIPLFERIFQGIRPLADTPLFLDALRQLLINPRVAACSDDDKTLAIAITNLNANVSK
jgi:hypothetical protein